MRYVMILLAFFVVVPVFAQSPQEASSTVGARYVEPSAKTPLKAGEKVQIGQPLGRALGRIGVELSRNGRHVSPALIAGSSQSLSKTAKGG